MLALVPRNFRPHFRCPATSAIKELIRSNLRILLPVTLKEARLERGLRLTSGQVYYSIIPFHPHVLLQHLCQNDFSLNGIQPILKALLGRGCYDFGRKILFNDFREMNVFFGNPCASQMSTFCNRHKSSDMWCHVVCYLQTSFELCLY